MFIIYWKIQEWFIIKIFLLHLTLLYKYNILPYKGIGELVSLIWTVYLSLFYFYFLKILFPKRTLEKLRKFTFLLMYIQTMSYEGIDSTKLTSSVIEPCTHCHQNIPGFFCWADIHQRRVQIKLNVAIPSALPAQSLAPGTLSDAL